MASIKRLLKILMSTLLTCQFLCNASLAGPPEINPVALKIATIAPEGSTWHRIMEELNADLKETTQGRVSFKIYPGGVAGDEKAVISKIRIGQLDGGAFTGFGMGEILPEERVMDLPFLFADGQEFNRVRAGLTPYFEKEFSEKGFVLVGWMDLGEVYLYGVKPIDNLKQLKLTKIWVWEGDTLAQVCWQELGVSPVSLSVVDVMMGLQTGMVDTVYNTALGAISFQWYVRTKYRVSTPMTYVSATLLIRKNVFEKLSDQDQQTLIQVSRARFEELNQLIRKQNAESIAVMNERGVQNVVWPEEDINELKKGADNVYQKLIGKQYSKELFDEVIRLRGRETQNAMK
jgi:TRAP-type C4-dicarboxylate transport system substrate-binding protein